MKLGYVASVFVLALGGFAIASIRLPPHVAASHTPSHAPQRNTERDRQALVELENEWLKGEHDAAVLERILAPDFVHPVPTGDFLTRAQHIYYSTKYLPPANLKNRFESLNVRLYGDVGVVNGIVATSDEHGREVDRTIFTDVFAYRGGRWQAINGQENRVEKSQGRSPQ